MYTDTHDILYMQIFLLYTQFYHDSRLVILIGVCFGRVNFNMIRKKYFQIDKIELQNGWSYMKNAEKFSTQPKRECSRAMKYTCCSTYSSRRLGTLVPLDFFKKKKKIVFKILFLVRLRPPQHTPPPTNVY